MKYIITFFTCFICVFVLAFAGCTRMLETAYPRIKDGESYTTTTQWGPVVRSVGPCWVTGKRRTTCWIQRDGMEPERVGMQSLPGQMVQVGERLGVYYKIGTDVVESYTVRDKWTKTMFHRTACFKKDADCKWPTKGE